MDINNEVESNKIHLQEDPIKKKLSYILGKFRVSGELLVYRRIMTGNINVAYYAAVYDGLEVQQLLIQRINSFVFKDPVSMMNNIELITQYIRESEKTMERRRRLHFRHTDEGKNYIVLDEKGEKEFWRLFNFVENSVSFESAEGDEMVLRMAGKAFGHFEYQLKDFDASLLVESIPHFHDTRRRLEDLFLAAEEDLFGRADLLKEDLSFIRENQEYACTLCDKAERGELPLRVTHNDTKTNNVLFDKDTLDPLVIIDLDTCMPGLASYDFGDAIRFAATTAVKDAKNPFLKKLDLNLFRAFTEGYFSEMTGILTEEEVHSMVPGSAIITLELGTRYLCDYLQGDQYFRISTPDQNLLKGRAQLALYKDIKLHLDEMEEIVKEIVEKYKTENGIAI